MCRNTQKYRLYSLMVFIILLTVVSVGQSALFFCKVESSNVSAQVYISWESVPLFLI